LNNSILLISPPFTQLNTPYPATAYLKGFLNTKKIASHQTDLGIEVILALFSKKGLEKIFEKLQEKKIKSENSKRIILLKKDYLASINLVIAFLQNKNPTLAHAICENDFLPHASRFNQELDLEWSFGTMGLQDKARHLATLYLEDISDLIKEEIDAHFGFSRYAESLGRSAATFDELEIELKKPNSFIDEILIEILSEKIKIVQPKLVLISVPFPGNLYSGLKCGQWIKKNYPDTKIALGGGFANTELRSVSDKRVFECVDFITLDDGERPVLNLIEYLEGKRNSEQLLRTFLLEKNEVVYKNGSEEKDFSQVEVGTPDYTDLFLDKYLSVIEMTNPMHSLWSNGRWNKLTLAHGCYWGKCTFCDTSLDYIKRYEQTSAPLLCDRIEELVKQTSENGFHFVDEAAPPALLRDLAIEILRRDLKIVWWTNIRFEKSFTHDLCKLLKQSGCIAMSGGLEVASDRLLELIDKGVSVAKVARVCRNFDDAGILVHAYLMYGYPTQTAQETIDSLEMVRQLFEIGVLRSGFWHRFAMTAHSPVGMDPKKYKTKLISNQLGTFANNDLEYEDESGVDHELFSEGLRVSLFNFMRGIGFEIPLQQWFQSDVPKTIISKSYIENVLEMPEELNTRPSSKILFLGNLPTILNFKKIKKGKEISMTGLRFINRQTDEIVGANFHSPDILGWLINYFPKLIISSNPVLTFREFQEDFEKEFPNDFEKFWRSEIGDGLRTNGLITV